MRDHFAAQLPRPRDISEFKVADSAGLTPARPSNPPGIKGRPTARRAFTRLAVTLGVAVGASILCLLLLPDSRIEGRGAIVLIVTMMFGFIATRSALDRFRTILVDELQAGYATFTFTQGLFWIPRRSSWRPTWGDDVIGWDWAGLWVLDADGNVVSEPDASVDPPGLYPSPNNPGHRELWTGHRWTGVFPNGASDGFTPDVEPGMSPGAESSGVGGSLRTHGTNRPTRRIVITSLGVAVVVSVAGIAATAVWLRSARDPSCGGDPDCDTGVALLAVFLMLSSLVFGAVCGAVTGAVLAIRRLPFERRRAVIGGAGMVAAVPLALVLFLLYVSL